MSYSLNDTIAAIATPLGIGGIGIIRISGPDAYRIVSSLFRPSKKISIRKAATHTIHHGIVHHKDADLDEALLLIMRGPNSYTGDDVAELSVHGSPIVQQHILAACIAHGARMAECGEFTYRAFMNGRIDLSRAEAVADLISSNSTAAASAAFSQLRGGLTEKIMLWREQLTTLITSLEASLDHSEEDISFISPTEYIRTVSALQKSLKTLIASAEKYFAVREGLAVAIIGKPNVGKSSLFNALLDRDRAIVTDIAGTTRDCIEEALEIDGHRIVIIDTAGLRTHTDDQVESAGHQRTRTIATHAQIVVWMLDANTAWSDDDSMIDDFMHDHDAYARTIVVVNKCDLPKKLHVPPSLSKRVKNVIPLSAQTGEGIPALEKLLASCAQCDAPNTTERNVIINIRHKDALQRTHDALTEALSAAEIHEAEEILAHHTHTALNALGEITGETASEEILERIFSSFCIGK